MGKIRDAANAAYADDLVPGTPRKPSKAAIRNLFGVVEGSIIEAAGGLLAFATWPELDAFAVTGLSDGQAAKVYDDAGTHEDPVSETTVDNAGVYRLVGEDWERIADLEAEAAREAKEAAEAAAAEVEADRAAVSADKETVAADKGIVAADKATTEGYKNTAQSAASTATAKADETEADRAAVAADKATTEGYKNTAQSAASTATAKADETEADRAAVAADKATTEGYKNTAQSAASTATAAAKVEAGNASNLVQARARLDYQNAAGVRAQPAQRQSLALLTLSGVTRRADGLYDFAGPGSYILTEQKASGTDISPTTPHYLTIFDMLGGAPGEYEISASWTNGVVTTVFAAGGTTSSPLPGCYKQVGTNTYNGGANARSYMQWKIERVASGPGVTSAPRYADSDTAYPEPIRYNEVVSVPQLPINIPGEWWKWPGAYSQIAQRALERQIDAAADSVGGVDAAVNFTGSISGTTLTSATALKVGHVISGAGVTAGTKIVKQLSSTTYRVNNSHAATGSVAMSAASGGLRAPKKTLVALPDADADFTYGLRRNSVFPEMMGRVYQTSFGAQGVTIMGYALSSSLEPFPRVTGFDPIATSDWADDGDGLKKTTKPIDGTLRTVEDDGYDEILLAEITLSLEGLGKRLEARNLMQRVTGGIFTFRIDGNTLHVRGMQSSPPVADPTFFVDIGQEISAPGIIPGTVITGFTASSTSVWGTAGTYTINNSHSIAVDTLGWVTPRNAVKARAGNKFVHGDAANVYTLATQPDANDTVTIGGHVITWKASGATGQQVNIGADVTESAANLAAYINSRPGPSLGPGVWASSSGGAVTITAFLVGTPGNNIATTRSGTGGGTWATPTLTGGGSNVSILMRPTDDATVIGTSHRYEYTPRWSAIDAGGYDRDLQVFNLEIDGASSGYGPFAGPARTLADGLIIHGGGTHLMVAAGGAVRRFLIYAKGSNANQLTFYRDVVTDEEWQITGGFARECYSPLYCHRGPSGQYLRGEIVGLNDVYGRRTSGIYAGALRGDGPSANHTKVVKLRRSYIRGRFSNGRMGNINDPVDSEYTDSFFDQIGRFRPGRLAERCIAICENISDPTNNGRRGMRLFDLESGNAARFCTVIGSGVANAIGDHNPTIFANDGTLAVRPQVTYCLIMLGPHLVTDPLGVSTIYGSLPASGPAPFDADYNVYVWLKGSRPSHGKASAPTQHTFEQWVARSGQDSHSISIDATDWPNGLDDVYQNFAARNLTFRQNALTARIEAACRQLGAGCPFTIDRRPEEPPVDECARILYGQ